VSKRLDVLTCTKCGAAIAFGDAATSTCPFCQTVNEVPAAYREMRDSKQLDAASRAEAERLLKKLDRPPWLVTKVIARMFDFNFLAFIMAYGVPFALWIIMGGLRVADRIARKLGYASADAAPFWITVTTLFGIVFVVIFLPRMVGIYANRRVSARTRLLAALAAKPAATEGGPALCRTCGAPLFVETGSLVAVCSYCATQNAIRLRTSLVAKAGKAAHDLAASVKDAAATDRTERRRTRLLLLRAFAGYVAIIGFYAYAFSVSDHGGWGTFMLVLASLLLIALPFVSPLITGAALDADERRSGNDVPGWVAMIGPVLVWIVFVYGPRGCL